MNNLEQYVVENFQDALKGGDIQVYYQPIVRTLGEGDLICAAESLARWHVGIDDVILPDEILPIMERHNLMVPFDEYMIEKVCRNVRYMEENAHSAVPSTINLSVESLKRSDLVDFIESCVRKYDMPRDLVTFEIPQSALQLNDKRVQNTVEKMKSKGYPIWLDDYTGGYEVIKALGDVKFDEVKIDVKGFDVTNESDRQVLRYSIKMLKKLGIRTIAERVENAELAKFLIQIGCDKVQGNGVVLPMPSSNVIPFLEGSNYRLESGLERQYLDKICDIDRTSDEAIAISEYRQEKFNFLYFNEKFTEVYKSFGVKDMEEVNYMLNSPMSSHSRQFRFHQNQTQWSDDTVQMDYSVNGNYFRLISKRIAETSESTANFLTLKNITSQFERDKESQLDKVFRSMYSLYDSVLLFQADNTMKNVMIQYLGNREEDGEREEVVFDVPFILDFVHPKDRDEFKKYLEYDFLKSKLQAIEKGYITLYFRSSTPGTGYEWKAHTFQYLPDMDWILYSMKTAPLYQEGLLEKITSEYSSDEKENFDKALLNQLKNSETVNWFYKDKDRTLMGASQKFLKDMGFEDDSSFVGKKDEDLCWLMDTKKAVEDDLKILDGQLPYSRRIEKSISMGITRNFAVSKEAISQNGRILGLLCSFEDLDEYALRGMVGAAKDRDKLTGLLSGAGMLETVSEHVEALRLNEEKFAIINIHFKEHEYHYEFYGEKISDQIAIGVSTILREVARTEAIIARLYAGEYSILKRYNSEDEIHHFVKEIETCLKNVNEIEGHKVTFYPEIRITFGDDSTDNEELISTATGGMTLDVKQKRHLEEQLESFNLQLDTVVDTLPGGIVIFEVRSGSLKVAYASKGVSTITGKSVENYIFDVENDYSSGIVVQDAEMIHDAVVSSIEENKDLNATFRYMQENGKVLWVNMQGKVIGYQNNHPLLLSVFRSLSESTSIYEDVLDEAKSHIFVCAKADGEILYVNQSALSFVSEQSEEKDAGIKRYYADLKELCTEERRVLVETGDGSNRIQYEIEYHSRNLLVFFVEGIWNGRESTICYVSDITGKYIEEREKAERESLLYLEAINASYDLVVTFNLTKNTFDLHLNSSLLGYEWNKCKTCDDFVKEVGRHMAEGFTDYDGNSVASQLKNFYEGIRHLSLEQQMYDMEGNLHWVSERIVYEEDPVSKDVIGIILASVIDEEVRARDEQKRRLQDALNEANAANQAKSQFLSNMSHDIRTPMNAIFGYANIASEHIDDKEIVEDGLHNILYAGNHLLDLINDVLDMSRIESGKETLNIKAVNLDDIEREIKALIEPLAEEKKINLTIESTGVTHRDIMADFTKFRRIIVNILSNAIKFTGDGGTVSSIMSEVASADNIGTYRIVITDTGSGMSPEFLEHIYEMFSRERSSTESKVSGTGLGMAITKRYVDLMDGTIDVSSEQNVGTKVTIELPLEYAEVSANETSLGSADYSKLEGRRVLVVDDNAMNRDIACLILKEIKVLTETAEDGTIAVEKLLNSEDGYYDCVLMDIHMPVMDGFSATREIRANDRVYLKNIPIIALSADAFTEDVKNSLEAGMNDHIAKPFVLEDLCEKMARLL